jgi:hypothetical protein
MSNILNKKTLNNCGDDLSSQHDIINIQIKICNLTINKIKPEERKMLMLILK